MSKIDKLLFVFSVIFAILFCIFNIYIKIINIDKTELRILIIYWRELLVLYLAAVLPYSIMLYKRNKKK